MAFDLRGKFQLFSVFLIILLLLGSFYADFRWGTYTAAYLAGLISLGVGIFLLLSDFILGTRQLRHEVSRFIAKITYIVMIIGGICLSWTSLYEYLKKTINNFGMVMIITYVILIVIIFIGVRVSKRQVMARDMYLGGRHFGFKTKKK